MNYITIANGGVDPTSRSPSVRTTLGKVRYRVGGKLRAAREQRILTQAELAKLADLSEQTVRQLELGNQRARATTLRALAKALRVQPQDLIEEDA
jgi:DNA-binding XRE family transcriptional regulator